MKKEYKFDLPKGKEVKSTNVRVEKGKVILECEFENEFNPKDGDFCISDTGLIFINKKYCNGSSQSYIGINSYGKISLVSCFYQIMKNGRFATQKEKSTFLKRLEKEYNKRWNPKEKKLEDIRWRPRVGETYYYINGAGVVCETQYTSVVDEEYFNVYNCFKTKKDAQPYSDQIKEIFKNSKSE